MKLGVHDPDVAGMELPWGRVDGPGEAQFVRGGAEPARRLHEGRLPVAPPSGAERRHERRPHRGRVAIGEGAAQPLAVRRPPSLHQERQPHQVADEPGRHHPEPRSCAPTGPADERLLLPDPQPPGGPARTARRRRDTTRAPPGEGEQVQRVVNTAPVVRVASVCVGVTSQSVRLIPAAGSVPRWAAKNAPAVVTSTRPGAAAPLQIRRRHAVRAGTPAPVRRSRGRSRRHRRTRAPRSPHRAGRPRAGCRLAANDLGLVEPSSQLDACRHPPVPLGSTMRDQCGTLPPRRRAGPGRVRLIHRPLGRRAPRRHRTGRPRPTGEPHRPGRAVARPGQPRRAGAGAGRGGGRGHVEPDPGHRDGTPGDCTSEAVVAAVAAGGVITFSWWTGAGDDHDEATARSATPTGHGSCSTAAAWSR